MVVERKGFEERGEDRRWQIEDRGFSRGKGAGRLRPPSITKD
jgi:hypothetical protein